MFRLAGPKSTRAYENATLIRDEKLYVIILSFSENRTASATSNMI
jgi:hypothetical protein